MDAQYLQEHVGDVLASALAKTSLIRPDDPIEYLGQYLLKEVENQAERARVKEEARLLALDLEEASALDVCDNQSEGEDGEGKDSPVGRTEVEADGEKPGVIVSTPLDDENEENKEGEEKKTEGEEKKSEGEGDEEGEKKEDTGEEGGETTEKERSWIESEEITALIFEQADDNGDYRLSKSEVHNNLHKIESLLKENGVSAVDVFERIQNLENDEVTWPVFVYVIKNADSIDSSENEFNEQWVEALFEELDKDDDGKVSASVLRNYIRKNEKILQEKHSIARALNKLGYGLVDKDAVLNCFTAED